MTTQQLLVQGREGRRPFHASWFCGARSDLLALCPSEVAFYNGLGVAVLLTALLSGTAFAVVGGYVLSKPAWQMVPFALVWAVLILNCDRMLQMLTTTRRHFAALLPRLVISIVIGILLAEPLTLVIFQREISRQVAIDTQSQIEAQTRSITYFYSGPIATAKSELAAINDREALLQGEVLHYQFLGSCEAGDTSCSTTHKLGCGPFCQHDKAEAGSLQSQLNAMRAQDAGQVAALRSQIATLSQRSSSETTQSLAAVTSGNGLLAREDALSRLMASHSTVLFAVWLIRLALVLLDLLPLIIKYLHLTDGGSAYERLAAAHRRREGVEADRVGAASDVELARIADQAAADIDLNRARIEADRVRKLGDFDRDVAYGFRDHAAPGLPLVSTPRLSDLIDSAIPHESMKVAVPPRLRRGALVGLALAATSAAVLVLASSGSAAIGMAAALAVLSAVGGIGVAIATSGFRNAGPGTLRALHGLFIVGLLLSVSVIPLLLT